jgi:hypothetical protein
MDNQTLIAIKAPAGTTLEVPDPDEGMSNGKRRYEIWLENENRNPIDVILLSKDDANNNNNNNNNNPEMLSPEANNSAATQLPEGVLEIPLSPQKSGFGSPVKLNIAVSTESTDQYLNPNFVGVSDFFEEGEEQEKTKS